MKPLLKVIGLMSGTSTDGLDIALVDIHKTSNSFNIKPIHFKTYFYEDSIRRRILDITNSNSSYLKDISQINNDLGLLFGNKIIDFINEFNLDKESIDLISSHGHTFYHYVDNGKTKSTLQLGDPSVIANITGITTVGDFRVADVAKDGQGAPLVPFFDYHFFKNKSLNISLQNIGGISNLCCIDYENQELKAFDTGPGNIILDELIKIISNNKVYFDKDGAEASKGKLNQYLLDNLLNDEYFSLKPPKTTGREKYGYEYVKEKYNFAKSIELNDNDILFTFNYFVAYTIYKSYLEFLPKTPEKIVLSGGGSYNKTLVKNLKNLFHNKAEILLIDDFGISSDSKEAIAFALLGYCTIFGISNNLPKATGAKEDVIMGKICPGKNFNKIIFKPKNEQLNEITEKRNILSEDLDKLAPLEIVELMNLLDYDTLLAVEKAKKQIAKVIEMAIGTIENNNKIFYIGAGTSGRLGILDAVECPPTFKTDYDLVQGIIAGGNSALFKAVEGAEDSAENGKKDIEEKLSSGDILIGISANGKAKYVLSALKTAKELNCKTVLITCNNIDKEFFIDELIVINTGSEVLSGSTRLKAGTATKMVLNMITTATFTKTGKVYKNYMIDLNVSNEKLKRRAINIIKDITKIEDSIAEKVLEEAEGSVKTALLMLIKNIDKETSKKLLKLNKGFLRKVIENSNL